MSKQKWLWGMIVLLLVVSSTGMMKRWNAEQSNDTYEVVIPLMKYKLLVKIAI